MNKCLTLKKQLCLVFDSCDMTGKTTIATRLAEILGISVFKFTREHDRYIDFMNMLTYTAETQIQMLEQTKLSVIFDRFVPSEYAYSKAFKRFTCEPKIWDIDERLAKLGGIIIYCYKTPKNYEKDDLDLIQVKDYPTVEKFYEEYFQKTKCRVLKLCTDDYDTEAQVKRIIKKLKEWKAI
jgi:deoxyadenosine/deoxycytidine kinase